MSLDVFEFLNYLKMINVGTLQVNVHV